MERHSNLAETEHWLGSSFRRQKALKEVEDLGRVGDLRLKDAQSSGCEQLAQMLVVSLGCIQSLRWHCSSASIRCVWGSETTNTFLMKCPNILLGTLCVLRRLKVIDIESGDMPYDACCETHTISTGPLHKQSELHEKKSETSMKPSFKHSIIAT